MSRPDSAPEEVAKLLLHKAREALTVPQRRGLRAEGLEVSQRGANAAIASA